MKNSNAKDIIVISLKLIIICIIVAIITASVNIITKDKISLNEMNNKANDILDVYVDDFNNAAFEIYANSIVVKDKEQNIIANCKKADCTLLNGVTEVYEILDSNGAPYSFSVLISTMGFNNIIEMVVAVNPDLTVKDVNIISMSETKDMGTKALSPKFLSQFTNITAEETKEVDVISGATITTKAIIKAVSASVEQVASYIAERAGEINE